MGTYCTTTSLEVTMIGLTFNTATSALASKLIDYSENEINKYLSKRYDLSASLFQTSTAIPPLITSLCETLAEGYLWGRLARGGKESLIRSDRLVGRVRKNLELIQDYKADIIGVGGSLVPDKDTGAYRVLSNTDDYTPTFDEDNPLNWSIDSGKLSDIADERD